MNINKPNDNKNMGQIDYGIFYTLCILLSIGVIMVYSASSFYAMFHNNDSMYFFKRQLIWAIIGIISMSIMMSIDYHKLKKITPLSAKLSANASGSAGFFGEPNSNSP